MHVPYIDSDGPDGNFGGQFHDQTGLKLDLHFCKCSNKLSIDQ